MPDPSNPAVGQPAPDDPLGRLAASLRDLGSERNPGTPSTAGTADPLPSSDAPDLVPPHLRRLRRYVVLRPLGRGGMGAVYLAHPRDLPDREVALKVLPPFFADDPVRLERFRREATTASRIDHPGVARVHEVGDEQGVYYQIQDLVPDGRTLSDWLREARDARTLPKGWYRDVAATFEQVARALSAVHAANVIHRDIKPSNILLLPDGRPKVADFGLAKDLEGASGLTRDGSPGTLNYQSPEQIDRRFGKVGERSDVYAFGATLYEALTLTRLHPGDEPAEVRPRILRHDVEDLRQARPGVPRELSVVCRKCLEREPGRRYPTMAAVAEELARYLRNEPILAAEPGVVGRARKWSKRNPTASAVLSTVTAGVVLAGWLANANAALAESESKAREAAANLAQEKGALADSEAAAKQVAQDKVNQFHQLSAVVRLKDVVAAQEALWLSETDRGSWLAKIPALEAWLDGPCARLLAQRPAIEATVADLRSRALPLTKEQIEADRRASPSYAAWERQSQLVASLRRAQAIRDGKEALVLPELPSALRDADALELNSFAWPRVAPEAKEGAKVERTVFGEEALALVAARAAVAKSADAQMYGTSLLVLTYALLVNGQDAEAKQRMAEALSKAPKWEREAHEGYRRDLEPRIAESTARLSAAETQLAQLDAEVGQRRTWTFGTDPDSESARFLHDALVGALMGMDGLSRQQKPDVERRLRWARSVGDLSLAHPRARHTWGAVRDAIAKADGVVASNLYAGKGITIPDAGWPGLVPIGMNPVTKLWEFYDLRSAWDGESEPAQIAIPQHNESDGTIEVTAATGIVFVLLPGGTYWMGSQKEDPNGPNYDLQSRYDETLHEVTLSPYLLARHELTQSQWSRLWTWDPELRDPSNYKPYVMVVGKRITGANPVEHVDWPMSDRLLSRHGMSLPTEAQWEYGCRGGTQTAWQVALEDLRKVANVASADAKATGGLWPCETWRDGHVLHARVGSFDANAYGLHDMHGNVLEWCRDGWGGYGSERGGDGLRLVDSPSIRYNRGGSFDNPAALARSANRISIAPSFRNINLGLRPARIITW